MYTLKTKQTNDDVAVFLASVADEQQKADCFVLIELFERVTKQKPIMWGKNLIGFGSYTYIPSDKKPKTWFVTGFSPRKGKISVYIMPGVQQYTDLLAELGKYKTTKGSCLYIRQLADVKTDVLATIIEKSVEDMRKMYEVE